jgi:hypothetical protein
MVLDFFFTYQYPIDKYLQFDTADVKNSILQGEMGEGSRRKLDQELPKQVPNLFD